HVDHHLGMINPLANSPQITASGSFLRGNTVPCSGSYLIGQGWNVRQMNQGAQWLALTLMPWIMQLPQDQPLNLLDAMLHPEGMTRHMTNLEEVAPAMLAHLRDDASTVPELLPRVEMLTAQIQKRLGKRPLIHYFNSAPRQTAPVLTTRFSTAHGELAFFSMFSTFGTPQDITLASLRVEHLFAADDATRAVIAAQAGRVAMPP
ncbi:MAG: hypothetical protein KBF66_12370, partial [Rhodoferax sp.]|nr:hypothetical protein [Rhodoferax sp.]